MKGPRHVPTRGWITCADFEGLLRLPVARACPSPRLRTGVKGDGHVRGRDYYGQLGLQGGRVKWAGQREHHVKEYVRGHGSGDVVGIIYAKPSSMLDSQATLGGGNRLRVICGGD